MGHDAIPIRGKLCAALLVAGPGAALSHGTAAHVLALLPSMPPFVETTTTKRAARNRPGLAASEALVLKLVTEHQLKTQRGPGAAVLRTLVVGRSRSRFERAFLKAVVTAGLPRPLQNHPIGPYTVDFFWPSHNLVIETDGNRYHDHVLARRRDGAKTAHLRALGYRVERVRTVREGLSALEGP